MSPEAKELAEIQALARRTQRAHEALNARVEQLDREAEASRLVREDLVLKSGIDLVTSRPGSDPAANGVEPIVRAKRGRKEAANG